MPTIQVASESATSCKRTRAPHVDPYALYSGVDLLNTQLYQSVDIASVQRLGSLPLPFETSGLSALEDKTLDVADQQILLDYAWEYRSYEECAACSDEYVRTYASPFWCSLMQLGGYRNRDPQREWIPRPEVVGGNASANRNRKHERITVMSAQQAIPKLSRHQQPTRVFNVPVAYWFYQMLPPYDRMFFCSCAAVNGLKTSPYAVFRSQCSLPPNPLAATNGTRHPITRQRATPNLYLTLTAMEIWHITRWARLANIASLVTAVRTLIYLGVGGSVRVNGLTGIISAPEDVREVVKQPQTGKMVSLARMLSPKRLQWIYQSSGIEYLLHKHIKAGILRRNQPRLADYIIGYTGTRVSDPVYYRDWNDGY